MATLYRFHDTSGRLLYVGATADAPRRLDHHRHTGSWFTEAATATFTHYPSWREAHAAEREAIATEAPKYNVADTRDTHAARMARAEAKDRSGIQPNVALTEARIHSGFSKAELAERVGIDRTLVTRLENGERRATPAVASKLAAALGIPAESLFSAEPRKAVA